MRQGAFDFGPAAAPAHPIVVLRWREGRVDSTWPELGLRATFASWSAALATVLHPVNAHVRPHVRR